MVFVTFRIILSLFEECLHCLYSLFLAEIVKMPPPLLEKFVKNNLYFLVLLCKMTKTVKF